MILTVFFLDGGSCVKESDPHFNQWQRFRGGLSGSDRGGESGRNSGAGLDEGDLFEEPPLGPARVVLGL